MSKSVGRLAAYGVKRESTRGTAETSGFTFIRHKGASFDDTVETATDESGSGFLADAIDIDSVEYGSEGEMPQNVRLSDIGWWFLAALGSVPTTGSGSIYSHTFNVLENAQHPSFTVVKFDPASDTTYAYANALLRSLTISGETGGYVEIEDDWVGRKGATITKPTISFDNDENSSIVQKQVRFEYPSGTAIGDLKSFTITITKDLEKDISLGEDTPNDYLVKSVSVEGSVEVMVDSELFKTQMRANTKQSFEISLFESITRRIQINLKKVLITGYEAPSDLDGIITATVEFKGMVDASSSKLLDIVLVNKKSSYA